MNYNLCNVRYWNLQNSRNSNYICGVSRNVFEDYMNFLCDYFREDAPLIDLYNEYLVYLYKLYGVNGKINNAYLSLRAFEIYLNKMYLKTYVAYDENYKPIKYVVYDNKSYLKAHSFNED